MGKLGYQLRVINEKSLKNMSFICDLLDRDFLEHISKIFLVERDQGSYRTLADLMKIFVEMTQFARKKIKATLPALFT